MTLSFKVFMKFVDEDGDASRVLSKDCYDTWVATRKSSLKQPQESFRRVLTAHVCGMDGRRPFPPEVEKSLLKALRKREVWDCFRGTGVSIGIRGFRNLGYHESKQSEDEKQRKRDELEDLNQRKRYKGPPVYDATRGQHGFGTHQEVYSQPMMHPSPQSMQFVAPASEQPFSGGAIPANQQWPYYMPPQNGAYPGFAAKPYPGPNYTFQPQPSPAYILPGSGQFVPMPEVYGVNSYPNPNSIPQAPDSYVNPYSLPGF